MNVGFTPVLQVWVFLTVVVLLFCLYWVNTVSPAVELLGIARAYLPGGIFYRSMPRAWEHELWEAKNKLQKQVDGAHKLIPNLVALHRIEAAMNDLKAVIEKVKTIREPDGKGFCKKPDDSPTFYLV